MAFLGSITASYAQERTLSGYVSDEATGEPLVSATVYVKGTTQGTITNNYGFYSLTLPQGPYDVVFNFVGFRPDTAHITLDKDVRHLAEMKTATTTIAEVVITASSDNRQEQVNSTQMSKVNLQVANLMKLPALGGEVDIMKVIQMLPGVAKGGEGSTAILVRGGDPDQNLILLDEATVYNVSHLFGFFSVFNPDALHDMDMITGGFPAQYGGRLSSVLAINTSEGNQERFSMKGGVGLLSSRLTVQAPLVKSKGAISVSARRSYIDKVFQVAGVSIPYYFYDMNAKANYTLNEKNRIFVSYYKGNDVLYTPKNIGGQDTANLNLDLDFGFTLGNNTSTVRWNHIYSPKLFGNTSAIYTQFKYDIRGKFLDNSVYIGSAIRDLGVKSDYGWFINPNNTVKFGLHVINHQFKPNLVSAQGDIAEAIKLNAGKPFYTQEVSGYLSQDRRFTGRIRANYGVRVSSSFVTDKVYAGIEPRAAVVISATDFSSIKLSYARMKQYMHLVSSSTVALPTDLWYPVTANVKPQVSDQVALGYTYNIGPIKSVFTVETYYKWMRNLTEYKENSNLILNNNFEQSLLQGQGHSYGLEFLLKRDEGRLTGWASYTLSWSLRQFDGLNGGEEFHAKFDRRHNLALVASYRFTDRFSFSADYVYLSGARFTPQTGQYAVPNPSLTGIDIIPIYASRNSVSLNAGKRLDVNFIFAGKKRTRWHGEWHLGAYNTLNSPAPFRTVINYTPEKGLYYTQKSLIGFVPNVAYNFTF